jgi:Zn-dependent protease with chaperone function
LCLNLPSWYEKPGSATIQRSVPAMEIIATNALISINETFLVQLGSFLIFLYVMNRIMFRPLLSTISQRKEYIADFKEKILTGKEDLDRLSRDLDREQSNIVKEANKVVLSLEAEGTSGHLKSWRMSCNRLPNYAKKRRAG